MAADNYIHQRTPTNSRQLQSLTCHLSGHPQTQNPTETYKLLQTQTDFYKLLKTPMVTYILLGTSRPSYRHVQIPTETHRL